MKTRILKTKLLLTLALLIALTIGIVFVLHRQHKLVTGNSYTKGIPVSNSSQQGTNSGNTTSGAVNRNNSTADENSKSPSPNSTTADLLSPSGNFVSSHSQSLSQNSPINSVCNTTPGAMCEIFFTQGSIVKSLPTQMTDEGGATYWDGWHLQDIGITAGRWQVSAQASLGSRVQVAADANELVVTE